MVNEFPHKGNVASNTSRAAEATREAARIPIEKRKENVHIASARESVAAGSTFNIHIANPSGSGLDCNFAEITVSTRFQGNFTIYDDFSSTPSSGTNLPVDNLLMDSADENGMGNMTANRNVSFTASGSAHLHGVVPSGGQGANQIGGSAIGTKPLIEPDREIVIEISNTSTESESASITAIYTEEEK